MEKARYNVFLKVFIFIFVMSAIVLLIFIYKSNLDKDNEKQLGENTRKQQNNTRNQQNNTRNQQVKEQNTKKEIIIDNIEIFLGKEELIFDWSEDKCSEEDLPDAAARAFRNHEENIVIVSGNSPNSHFLFGKDFNSLKRNCNPVIISTDNTNAESFDNLEWITSTYTEDGKIIYALVHNEYHDPVARNCLPGDTTPRNLCWYNSLTFATSIDGGYSFNQKNSPEHLVAAPIYKWDSYRGVDLDSITSRSNSIRPKPYGYFSPSNIIKGKDGYNYVFIRSIEDPKNPTERGTCLMRTSNLKNPSAWRFWDGQGFDGIFLNPYQFEEIKSCKFIKKLGTNIRGLTYNTYLEKYIIISSERYIDAKTNRLACGVWFSISDNLVDWETPKLIKNSAFNYEPCKNQEINMDLYSTIIDHSSNSRSFDTSGKNPYLYFVRLNRWKDNSKSHLDRDLMRVRLDIKINN